MADDMGFKGLRLAGVSKAAEEEQPPIDARVRDFAHDHRAELYTSTEEIPTRLRDLQTLTGPVGPDTFFVSDLLAGSSLSGGAVEVANYRAFLERYKDAPGVFPLVGDHNSFAIAIRLQEMTEAMLQLFEGLQDYPALDDANVSQVEHEGIESAWEDWAKAEFETALAAKFPELSEEIYDYSDERLRTMFDVMRERDGIEWVADSGNSWFIDVKKVVRAAVPEDFHREAHAGGKAPTTLADVKELDSMDRKKQGGADRDVEHEQISQSTDQELADRLAAIESKGTVVNGLKCYPPAQLRELQRIQSELYCRKNGIASQPHTTAVPPRTASESMDDFTQAYFEAALFSSNDDNDYPMDRNYDISDFSPETKQKMIEDCETFQTENAPLLVDDNIISGRWDADQLGGHDFWLTRNGHGAGFWEKSDWDEEAGKKLTEAAKKFGEFDLYIGDDGTIWGSPLSAPSPSRAVASRRKSARPAAASPRRLRSAKVGREHTMDDITFRSLAQEYGKYTKDGEDYVLTQNPFIDYVAGHSNGYVVQGNDYYFAHGYDREGNAVRLIWDITNPETEDESEACDWDEFEVEPTGGDPAPWFSDASSWQERVNNATSLDDLCSILNEMGAEIKATHSSDKLEEYVDLAALPTFGGKEPSDTRGIWSWDKTRLLYADGWKWTIEAR